MHVESYCFCLKKPIVFLTYPFSLPSPSPSLSSLLKLESNCILSSKILNSPKFLTILCCSFIYFITTSFSGKVTIQEFRKLPTAAMDDYMNRLKETSPIHRDRNSNQAWIHQGSLAGDVMKRLRRRWVFEFRKYTKVALFVFVSVSFINIHIHFFLISLSHWLSHFILRIQKLTKLPDRIIRGSEPLQVSLTKITRLWFVFRREITLIESLLAMHAASFPIKYTIDSMVYCSHLPNLFSAGWLWRISRGIGANQKRRNILNE